MPAQPTRPTSKLLPDIPIDAVAKLPLPGMAIPGNIAFSHDDQQISFLYSPTADLVRQLYRQDIESGRRTVVAPPEDGESEENLPLEEKLRRERQRELHLGITHYAWSTTANRILVPLRGSIYVQDGIADPLRLLLAAEGRPAVSAGFSPDGEWVGFVRDAELHVMPSGGGEIRQLTFGAREPGLSRGLAEYIAQEEMGRHNGFWWSADSKRLAFTEVDERHIPVYRIAHSSHVQGAGDTHEDHRYPFAGQRNAIVRLGVVSIDGGAPVWMDLGADEDIYVARVRWAPAGTLLVQRLSRDQKRLDLLSCDPATGQSQLLLREESNSWINLHNLFYPLSDGRFIWGSERTGYRHLYLYDQEGLLIRPLTEGAWQVDTIAGLDQKLGMVYFTGTLDGAIESHLYAASLDGDPPRRLTSEPGTHSVVLDRAKRRFVDIHHAVDRPPAIRLHSLADGALISTVYDEADPRVEMLPLAIPELVRLPNRHGTLLHGAIFRPDRARFGPGPYPTVVSVYGGPHAQRVINGWSLTINMRAQSLCNQGYLVFALDNRGSARRGLAFEESINGQLGGVEVEDQVDGVNWLVAQGLADKSRIGVHGWSYGGYMTLLCLARAAEIFKVGVAGAPVTEWEGYDTCYTERYMGTPQQNPEGYAKSSVLPHAGGIQGKLLIVHGLLDENVHFSHTARLIGALNQAGKQYELLLFPEGRHSLRHQPDRIYLEERIAAFFREHL